MDPIYFKTNPENEEVQINANGVTWEQQYKDIVAVYPKTVQATKAEYDAYILKYKTLPNLSQDNINHNLFNNADSALRKSKQRYQNSLFTLTEQADGSFTRSLTKEDKVKYDNLNAYIKAVETNDMQRANEYVKATIAGMSSDAARTKAQAIVIGLDDLDALNGRNEFIGWLLAEHPTDLREYVSNVNALNYSTFLTEDESLPGDE